MKFLTLLKKNQKLSENVTMGIENIGQEYESMEDKTKEQIEWTEEKRKFNLADTEERKQFIDESCRQIVEAVKQIEEAKSEYDIVTSYLSDMDKIDSMQETGKKELEETAQKIVSLSMERTRYQKGRDLQITETMIKHFQKYEREIPDAILKIKEKEDYNLLVKNDLRNLEGEKGAILYEQQEIKNQQKYLKGISAVTGIVVACLFFIYSFAGIYFNIDMKVPFLLTILMGAASAFYISYESNKNRYQMKLSEKKLNKAISLQNNVKIKYINTNSWLSYMYEKYKINNTNEFSFLWQQYMKAKDEDRRYRDNTDLLNHYNEELISVLNDYGIKDTEIWLYQAAALINKKELVEVRHGLNTRRQNLRERVAYNAKIKETNLLQLQDLITNYTTSAEEVGTAIRNFGISPD